jgi:hypothetical protein
MQFLKLYADKNILNRLFFSIQDDILYAERRKQKLTKEGNMTDCTPPGIIGTEG